MWVLTRMYTQTIGPSKNGGMGDYMKMGVYLGETYWHLQVGEGGGGSLVGYIVLLGG